MTSTCAEAPQTGRVAALVVALWAAMVMSAGAQEGVSVQMPVAIGFPVMDVSRSTAGAPGPTRITYSDAHLELGKALRVSVQADASEFTPPSGAAIPAANVSWTTLGASGGIGSNGTLSPSSYTLVFQSDPAPTAGHVDLAWTLAAPGSTIRAGVHQLTIRWKLESIVP